MSIISTIIGKHGMQMQIDTGDAGQPTTVCQEDQGRPGISIAAHRNGFHGLIYGSVRGPNDIRLPDRNLVMFREDLVIIENRI